MTTTLSVPKVGDLATLCYPSDRYPHIVTAVSKTGQKITIQGINYRIVRGSFHTGDAVIEYSMPAEAALCRGKLSANFSPRRGIYTCGGTPVSIGGARFYQAPEV